MCTAVSFLSHNHYFGRNLDLEYCYQESVTITPRNFPLAFRTMETMQSHYALIGTATVSENYPLYYDATNEAGLSMAGLSFQGNAFYKEPMASKENIAPFELIPWVLGQCRSVAEALHLLKNTNLAAIAFSPAYSLSDLHWMLSDRTSSIVIEPLADGLRITENPVGVLTNNPPIDYHLHNLKNYMNLSQTDPKNLLAPELSLLPYSRGMGAMGLPGDLSSASRFVRATFTKMHSVRPKDESSAVNQFFHILGSVTQQEGCVQVGEKYEKTVYSSCCNTDKAIYYYTTYENSRINAVYLHREDLDGSKLTVYPLDRRQHICEIN